MHAPTHTPTAVGPPLNPRAIGASPSIIAVTWDAVTPLDGTVSHYEVVYSTEDAQNRTADQFLSAVNTTERLICLSNLTASTSYAIAVRAFTEDGPGPYSDVVIATTSEGTTTDIVTTATTLEETTSTVASTASVQIEEHSTSAIATTQVGTSVATSQIEDTASAATTEDSNQTVTATQESQTVSPGVTDITRS